MYGPQPIPYGYTMKDGSPMPRCELKECINQCKAYGKYSEVGEKIPPGMAKRYGGSGQGMFTTTAGHSTEAEQQGAAYAARRKAATDKTQLSQPVANQASINPSRAVRRQKSLHLQHQNKQAQHLQPRKAKDKEGS